MAVQWQSKWLYGEGSWWPDSYCSVAKSCPTLCNTWIMEEVMCKLIANKNVAKMERMHGKVQHITQITIIVINSKRIKTMIHLYLFFIFNT